MSRGVHGARRVGDCPRGEPKGVGTPAPLSPGTRHCPGPDGRVCDAGPLRSPRGSPAPRPAWGTGVSADPPAGLQQVPTNGRNCAAEGILLTLFKTPFSEEEQELTFSCAPSVRGELVTSSIFPFKDEENEARAG